MSEAVPLGQMTCPLPWSNHEQVLLGHGSGGKLTAELIEQVFLPAFGNPTLSALEDQATLSWEELQGIGAVFPLPFPVLGRGAGGEGGPQKKRSLQDSPHPGPLPKGEGDLAVDGLPSCNFSSPRFAFTTDSFVVRPLFFPGGDIGRLAVHGTVNDLAVGGAIPRFLSAAFILEEGLTLQDLSRIVTSMRQACDEAGVTIVAGDTKVVDRGKGDGVFIATSGIGLVPAGLSLSIRNPRPGDVVLVSGTIGDHGIAILSVREGLEFETELASDTASLAGLTQAMLAVCPRIRWMRDPTRGGLSSALNEMAGAAEVGVRLEERALPIRPEVTAACELLGLDPLYVANEGKLIAVVSPDDAEMVLAAMRAHPLGCHAARIGVVTAEHPGMVIARSGIGGQRVVSMLSGEQLPRIC